LLNFYVSFQEFYNIKHHNSALRDTVRHTVVSKIGNASKEMMLFQAQWKEKQFRENIQLSHPSDSPHTNDASSQPDVNNGRG
jgi:hypothetical protein